MWCELANYKYTPDNWLLKNNFILRPECSY